MEYPTLTSAILLIALTVVPIVWLLVRENRKNSTLNGAVKEFVRMYGRLNYDKWLNCALTQSQDKNEFRFVRKIGKDAKIIDFSVNTISKCSIVKNHTHKGNSESSHSQTLDLVLSSPNGETVLTFYNSEYDGYTMSGQMQYIEKWNKVINELIK